VLFVKDIKQNYENYGLPLRFVEALPDTCEECGSSLAISETMTGLHCSNPRCKDKLIMRIRSVCRDLGIVDFGESTIGKFIDYYGVTNHLNFFDLKKGMILSDEVSDKVSEKVIEQVIRKKDFLLWEFVQVANLPYIRTSARKIFQGYNSISEAFQDIEDGGVDFIQNKLGIAKEDTVSLQAMKIYSTLMEFKDDLIEGEECVNIIKLEGKKELNVVCSDQVGGGFSKKPEFYAYIKNRFGDKVHVNFLSSVTKNIDYLVWAGADGSPARYTSKVQKVERYNEKGSNIPIVTASQFINEMEAYTNS
jgi:NAD-dependent DNA ligase